MASRKQVVANRSNAKKSTGPKTEVGKAKSRQNAWKHGFAAERIVVGEENSRELEALHTSLEEEWKPVGVSESMLVERLATILWRLRRIPEFEAAVMDCRRREVADGRAYEEAMGVWSPSGGGLGIDPLRDELGSALIQDSKHGDTLAQLQRYEANLSRDWMKSIQRLTSLQTARYEREQESKQIEG